MPRQARHDGRVVRCPNDRAGLHVQLGREEDNEDVDDVVRFVLTPVAGASVVLSGAPRQHVFEGLAPGTWVVSVEFESPRPRYVLDGEGSMTFELKKGDFEFAVFQAKRRPWLEVEFVDEETNQAIAGANVRLRAVDGGLLDAKTDELGIARFEHLDVSDYVVEDIIAPPTSPRPDGQRLAPLRLTGGEEWATTAGTTLGALAQTHADRVRDWRELALFNFGTDDVRALRRAMFELVGCRIQALGGNDPSAWAFDGDEATRGGTGRLLLPLPRPTEPLGQMKRRR